ncbi:MAG: aminotransferase class V-fold PLP-dependent enzyme [Ktedonobacteraceae bacterium]|nr:aminotransferase class V-fold PLP-dependent enzyme [Ktedonobacteraceae bacterium]
MDNIEALRYRIAPLEMTESEFRKAGRQVIERIAEWQCSLPNRPVAPNELPDVLREALGTGSLPEQGAEARALLEEAATLLFEHSVFNGHPRFLAMITSSAAPIGALADLLAAAINPNVGAWTLAPIATEIEAQTIRWIAELIDYPTDCGGLLVSGGNMGNFIGLLAARTARLPWDVRTTGLIGGEGRRLRVYSSQETHTWLHKAVDLFGLGVEAIRWIPVDAQLRMDTAALRRQLQADNEAGDLPFLVIGTAGTVSTGAVDPLPEIAAICREYDLWFHVDGAYGSFAAALLNSGSTVEVPPDLQGISLADSVAVDPHKWLYAPLEAGCALVRDPAILRRTFSHHPAYFYFDEDTPSTINYHEYGPQNSRSFRALKVWLGLRQAGRAGYVEMISDDIRLAQELSRLVKAEPELQAFTQSLSITTFRYIPSDLTPGSEQVEAYLNRLNAELVMRLQRSGEAFLSNAVIGGTFLLRACIVNFRTALEDIEALPGIIIRIGREIDATIRPTALKQKERNT